MRRRRGVAVPIRGGAEAVLSGFAALVAVAVVVLAEADRAVAAADGADAATAVAVVEDPASSRDADIDCVAVGPTLQPGIAAFRQGRPSPQCCITVRLSGYPSRRNTENAHLCIGATGIQSRGRRSRSLQGRASLSVDTSADQVTVCLVTDVPLVKDRADRRESVHEKHERKIKKLSSTSNRRREFCSGERRHRRKVLPRSNSIDPNDWSSASKMGVRSSSLREA